MAIIPPFITIILYFQKFRYHMGITESYANLFLYISQFQILYSRQRSYKIFLTLHFPEYFHTDLFQYSLFDFLNLEFSIILL